MAYPIIVRLQGGLGNQLYQYAIGRSLSVKMGRPLLLDKRTIEPEAPKRHYDLGVFNIQEQFVSGHLAWATRWVGSVRLGELFRRLWLSAKNYRYLRDQMTGYDPSIFSEHDGPIILFGYWQSYRYFESIEDILRKELFFTAAADSTNQAMQSRLRNSNSVAVHVRRGDYVSNPQFTSTLGLCDASYYLRAANYLCGLGENLEFFVFTDDPIWARDNLDLGAAFTVLDHNLGKADYEDMRLMSSCRHLIIANSSFSWWGAWLANRSGKKVITPSTWFVHDTVPFEDRVPNEWIQLDSRDSSE